MEAEFHCTRCGAGFEIPTDLPEAVKQAAAQFAREGSRVRAMDLLRRQAALPLDKAKCIALHLATPKGTCHRCRSLLSEDSVSICAKCHSLNLNW